MTEPVRPKRRFRLFAVLTSATAVTGAIAAFALGVTPAMAADLVQDPEAQVLVFLVPLTLLMAAILFEAVRVAWRGALPAEAPRPPRRRPWTQRERR